jgi:hypothetical protein
VVLGVLLIGGLIVGGYIAYCLLTDTTEGEIGARLERNVPRGSTADEVFAFLDSRNIEHSPIELVGNDGFCCILEDAGFSDNTQIIGAIFRDTGCDFPWCEGFRIDAYFILDEDNRVTDYFAWENATCLCEPSPSDARSVT